MHRLIRWRGHAVRWRVPAVRQGVAHSQMEYMCSESPKILRVLLSSCTHLHAQAVAGLHCREITAIFLTLDAFSLQATGVPLPHQRS